MKLKELLSDCEGLILRRSMADGDMEIRAVTSDSRMVEEGDAFAALAGGLYDGHHFTGQALERGAALLILEDESYCSADAPWLLTNDSRRICAIMEQNQAGKPSLKMNVVGVTGTNGKTSTCHMLAAILEEAGMKTGVIGSLYNRIGGRRLETDLTTPGSAKLAELFRMMAEEGTDYAIMEATSHALLQSRTAGIEFDLGIFTNLTPEHMDYHEDMGDYLNAKARLFSGLNPAGEKQRRKAAILNLDDSAGPALADYCSVPVITYGQSELCQIRAEGIELSPSGLRYTLRCKGEAHEIRMKLHGRFNVYNSLAAISAALVEGVDVDLIRRALEGMAPVPGRFQQVEDPGGGAPFPIFVDNSHTPDGLENCLSTAREITGGKVICVFGAGGGRDAKKRPLMGEVVARLSDVAIVTSDNPRDEEPAAIIRDILEGMGGPLAKAEVYPEADRRKAIAYAVTIAGAGDMVLICGKGDEEYQIVGGVKHRLYDFEEARKALLALDNRKG